MNLLVLCKTSDNNFNYMDIDIDSNNNIQIIKNTTTHKITDIPHVIVSENAYFGFYYSDKAYQDLLLYFMHKETVNNNMVFLKPSTLIRRDNIISNRDYYISKLNNNAPDYTVNYDSGKHKLFGDLYKALDWILNQHYPAQQRKQIHHNII